MSPQFQSFQWDRGRPLFRVALDHRGATEFADCSGGPRRFSPVIVDGKCVPVLYAASGPDAAVMETVFHDVVLTDPNPVAFRDDIVASRLSTLAPTRDLRLARFDDDALPALGVRRQDLIDTDATAYPQTVRWAIAAHADADGGRAFDGIVWSSRRVAQEQAIMLFGDRVDRRHDLDVVEPPLPLHGREGYLLTLRIATKHGITVVH